MARRGHDGSLCGEGAECSGARSRWECVCACTRACVAHMHGPCMAYIYMLGFTCSQPMGM